MKYEKFLNIDIIFSIIMIILLIMHFDTPFLHVHEDTNVILEEYDFTGLTSSFRMIFFIVNLIALLVCGLLSIIIKQKKKYSINYKKILVILFIMLSILPFIGYITTREKEKEEVKELAEELESLWGKNIISLNSKKDVESLNKYSNSLKTDPFFVRKVIVAKQLKNDDKSTIIEALEEFLLYPVFKKWNDDFDGAEVNELEVYYAIFPGYSYIDIICAIFYFITSKIDDNEESNEENVRIGEIV